MPKPIAGQACAQRVAPAFLLGRLFIYGNSEDSAGAISRVMGSMADLHAQGCTTAPPGVTLIKPLRALMAGTFGVCWPCQMIGMHCNHRGGRSSHVAAGRFRAPAVRAQGFRSWRDAGFPFRRRDGFSWLERGEPAIVQAFCPPLPMLAHITRAIGRYGDVQRPRLAVQSQHGGFRVGVSGLYGAAAVAGVRPRFRPDGSGCCAGLEWCRRHAGRLATGTTHMADEVDGQCVPGDGQGDERR